MITLFHFIIALFERIPLWFISTIARISVGTVFLRSGLTKIEGWESGSTLYLFANEYKLPVIPPEIAAYMATAAELTLPFFLFAGLFTRFAAFALLIMTLVIQIFVYPNAFDTHGVWAVCFLFLMKYGAGPLSLDTIIARYWAPSPANKPMGA
jgi:putative oxidoreductase